MQLYHLRHDTKLLVLLVIGLAITNFLQYWNLFSNPSSCQKYFIPHDDHNDDRSNRPPVPRSHQQHLRQSSSFSSWANGTAIVIRTRFPFSLLFLEKIFRISQEMEAKQSPYDFILLVDITSVNNSTNIDSYNIIVDDNVDDDNNDNDSPQTILTKYYQGIDPTASITGSKGNQNNNSRNPIIIPTIVAVNEAVLLQEFPRLSNYLYNHNPNEYNVNHQPGWCCGNSLMWQLLVPTFVYMMVHHHDNDSHNKYKYMWCLEDDIETVGVSSLFQMIQTWDLKMEQQQTAVIDLAAITLLGIGKLQKGSAKQLHTPSFHAIVQKMMAATTKRQGADHNHGRSSIRNKNHNNNDIGFTQTTPWTSMSDAIHRYSKRFAKRLHEKIYDNTFAWAETFVHPIAWEGNFSVLDLRQFLKGGGDNDNDDSDEQYEIYAINQHKDRTEALEYLWKNHGGRTSSRGKLSRKKKTTIVFHGPSLDQAHLAV
jgi:hypothetical protein